MDYASLFDLEPVTFEESLRAFGYKSSFETILEEIEVNGNPPSKQFKDIFKLMAKWYRGFRKNEFTLKDLRTILNPVTQVSQLE